MKDFNWVEARSRCSLAKVFKELETSVRRDVDAVNQLALPTTVFSLDVKGNHVVVIRERKDLIADVRFTLHPSRISAIARDGKEVSALPSLNEHGECKLSVNGADMELWQFCRLVLEPLFFLD